MDSEQIAHLCEGIPVQVIPGFTEIQPFPQRSDKIDPETKLKRKPPIKPLHEGQWVDRDAEFGTYARRIREKKALHAQWP